MVFLNGFGRSASTKDPAGLQKTGTPPGLWAQIKGCLALPDETSLSLTKAMALSRQLGLDLRTIEWCALENGVVPNRYKAHQDVISRPEQIKLLEARIAVIGCGGLGGYVVELLARAGIGHLTLVDGDLFEEQNLNRQLACTIRDLDQPKAAVTARRVAAVNPAVHTRVFCQYLDAANASELLTGVDMVVDCLDSAPRRLMLEKAARAFEIPLVSGAIAGNTGQIATVFPEKKGLQALFGDTDHSAPARNMPAYTAMFTAGLLVCRLLQLILKRPFAADRQLVLADVSIPAIETVKLS